MAQRDLPVFPFDTPPQLDTDPKLEWLRRWDPVPKVRLAPGGEAYLATRYEDVKRVFADPVFRRAQAVKPGAPALRPQRQNPYLLVSMDPPGSPRPPWNASPPPTWSCPASPSRPVPP
jgi:cytochrome P450